MSNFIDLTGKKFNRLTVIERMDNSPKGIVVWKCQCECGNYTFVRGSNLKSGAVKSCGCLGKDRKKYTHCESKTKLYRQWKSMMYRCYKPNHRAYHLYGGRGIRVCEEWKTYEGFKEWVLQTKPKDGDNLTVDRINVDGDYSPQNCRWVDMKTQANNRRSCRYYEYNGEVKDLMEWCDELSLDYKRVHNRIYKLKWSFERAITTPVNDIKRNKEAREKYG